MELFLCPVTYPEFFVFICLCIHLCIYLSLFIVYMYIVWAYYQSACVWELVGVGSLPNIWVLGGTHWNWQREPLSAEPPHQPRIEFSSQRQIRDLEQGLLLNFSLLFWNNPCRITRTLLRDCRCVCVTVKMGHWPCCPFSMCLMGLWNNFPISVGQKR